MPRIYRRLDPFSRYVTDPESGCWIWQGAKSSEGRAMVSRWTGECVAARLFAKHFNGPIHPELEVCHRCDNPSCVNPAHLFLGTKSDNQRDCEQKGRRDRRGERNPANVLSEDAVRSIWSDPRRQGCIAAEHGVHRTTINLIKTGRKWAHVTAGLGPAHRHPMGPPAKTPALNDH